MIRSQKSFTESDNGKQSSNLLENLIRAKNYVANWRPIFGNLV